MKVKEHLYFMHDALKNVTSIFDGQQTRRARYEYAPFGGLLTAEGDMARENKFRFSCEFSDDELGLVYYNYRHLNPADGRWINRDPIDEQGGANLYAFSGNAVINKLDLLGLKPALMDDYDNATKFLKKEVSKHILAALSRIIKKANFKMLGGRQTVEHGGALFRKKTANSYSYKVSNHEAKSKTYHRQPEVAPKNYCEVAIWHSHNIVFKHDGINEKTGFVLGGRLEGVFGPGSLSPEDERTGYGFVWANGHRVPKMDNPESVPAYVIQSTPKPARKNLRLKTLDQDIKTQFSEEDFTAILVARQIDDPQSNKEANIVILDEHGKPLLPKPRPPKSGKTRY
ncbi:RHS repeat domain-containing protein, partial [Akkermansia massiliensis]